MVRSPQSFDAAMATLVRSVMLGMKHAAPQMKKQGAVDEAGFVARQDHRGVRYIVGKARTRDRLRGLCAVL
jgi:hypothetical protein